MTPTKKCKGSIALFFIDGVGIGENDPTKNPFFSYPFKIFNEIFETTPWLGNVPLLCEHGELFPVDAAHGFPGYPQSGTGQLSIFGGFDAIKAFGGHFGPYAPLSVVENIYKSNLFMDTTKKGYAFKFINAYPRPFFNHLRKKPKRLNVTAHCMLSSAIPFNKSREVYDKQALTPEITNYRWRGKLGSKVPEISPEEAGKRFLRIMRKNDISVFEYYLTDYAGHRRYDGKIEEICEILDRFLFYIMKNFDFENDTLMVCSDHGNFEDISVKTHTKNPSLFIAYGKYAGLIKSNVDNLSKIMPVILELLKKNEKSLT
ncbi:MAG: metalloenzyme [Ignavibacteriaceae bacterium]|nr:metalloenzyme [Ignavibacteriaceae bacterium]